MNRSLRDDIEEFLAKVDERVQKFGEEYTQDDPGAMAFIALGSGARNFIDNHERRTAMRAVCQKPLPKKKKGTTR